MESAAASTTDDEGRKRCTAGGWESGKRYVESTCGEQYDAKRASTKDTSKIRLDIDHNLSMTQSVWLVGPVLSQRDSCRMKGALEEGDEQPSASAIGSPSRHFSSLSRLGSVRIRSPGHPRSLCRRRQ
jgi:hypothetical protein